MDAQGLRGFRGAAAFEPGEQGLLQPLALPWGQVGQGPQPLGGQCVSLAVSLGDGWLWGGNAKVPS